MYDRKRISFLLYYVVNVISQTKTEKKTCFRYYKTKHLNKYNILINVKKIHFITLIRAIFYTDVYDSHLHLACSIYS